MVFRLIDELEVADPAPDQIDANLRRIHLLRIAENVAEQELLLSLSE